MEQEIGLKGVGNARQLGGYRIGNRRIRDSLLLRTAGLGHITQEAKEALQKKYRVQTVVDLRTGMERDRQPDPEIPGAQNLHLPVIEMEELTASVSWNIDPKKLALFTDQNTDRMELLDVIYETGIMSDRFYIGFLLSEHGMAAYRSFFRALLELEEDRAILWHCTDGKDRTGCAAMLTLFALGADRETVYHDFLLTNSYNSSILENVRRKAEPFDFPEDKLNTLLIMCGAVSEAYMDNALDALGREFGSVYGYLSEALGVGDEEIGFLRRKFLTEQD